MQTLMILKWFFGALTIAALVAAMLFDSHRDYYDDKD